MSVTILYRSLLSILELIKVWGKEYVKEVAFSDTYAWSTCAIVKMS